MCVSSLYDATFFVKNIGWVDFYRDLYDHLSNYTKTIIRLRLVNIGEYSPRLRLGEYLLIFTSPSANNC